MLARVLADLVLLVHAAFAAFVALGGLLVVLRPRVAWLHVPCALYGAAIEFVGWVCPLTPLEQRLRRAAGQAGYSGGFLDHYLRGVLYPGGWEHVHVALGMAVVAGNVLLYSLAVRRWKRRRRETREDVEPRDGRRDETDPGPDLRPRPDSARAPEPGRDPGRG